MHCFVCFKFDVEQTNRFDYNHIATNRKIPSPLESEEAKFFLFLLDGLEVLEDGGDSEENTGTGADGAQEVGEDGESTNAHTTEQGGSGDVAVEDVNESGVTVALHGQTVIAELLGDITSRGAGELDPETGDEGAGAEHVGEVDDELERVSQSIGEGGGSIEVVDETANGTRLLLVMRPLAEKTDQEVVLPASGEELRDDHEVGGERGHDDDGGVGGVEQLDGVETLLTAVLGVLHGEFHTEALEVHDHEEHDHGGEEISDVGKTRTVESIAESADLVLAGDQAVEKSDDGTLEFLAATVVDGGGGEGSPHNRLADVGGNEQTDAGADAVTLLEELVQEEHDDTGGGELEHQEEAGEHTELTSRTVHTRDDIHEGSGNGENDAEELLHVLVQLTLFLDAGVEDDELETVEELHDHGRGDDGADTELHESATRC